MSRAETWLDALREREADRQAVAMRLTDAAVLWTARALLVLMILFLTIGLDPFPGGDPSATAGGSRVRQLVYPLLGLIGATLVLSRWQVAVAILVRSWPLLAVYGVMALTTVWSAFPEVTLRRFIVYLIVLVIGLGIASVLRAPRQYLPPLIAGLAAVILADWAATLAAPGRAFTDLGLAALHVHKNTAGMIAQTAAIAFAAGLIAVRRPAAFWAIAGLLLLTLAFLVLTRAKTSMAVTFAGVAILIPFFILARRQSLLVALAVAASAVGAGLVALLTGALSLGLADWVEIITGDPTLTARDQIWSAVVRHIAERPFLGYGFGAQWSMLPVYHPLEGYIGFWTGNRQTLAIMNQAHNGYLDLMLHGGLLLLCVTAGFLAWFVVVIARSVLDRSADRWMFAGSVMVAAYVATMIVHNITDSNLFFPDQVLGQILVFLVLAHRAWVSHRSDVFGRG